MKMQGLSTGATVALVIALAVVLIGSGILLGALVISSDDEATSDSLAQQDIRQADRAAVTTALVSDAAIRAEGAESKATVESASASLAYLQGVAALDQANRQIALAAAQQQSKRRQIRRLVQAQILARSAVVGARANESVRNAQAKARLKALSSRASAVQGAARGVQQKLAGAAGRAESAAQRQLSRLNNRLQRGAARLQRQLARALRAEGRELQRAIREIERELQQPIAVPLG